MAPQNMSAHYISMKSLIDLCELAERAPGSRVRMQWWEQEDINLVGSREAAVAAGGGGGEKTGWGSYEEDKKEDSRGGALEEITISKLN